MYYMQFKGKWNNELNSRVEIVQRPNIPAPELNGENIKIAGRDTELFVSDGSYKDIEIQVPLNFLWAEDDWMQNYRELKNYITGYGDLRFSDDMEYFYKVKKATIIETERILREAGKCTASFLCDPFSYLIDGLEEKTAAQSKNNPYYESHPIYKITGEGNCTLTVNGKKVTANIGQNLVIDTDKLLTYRENGSLENNLISGTGADYKSLYLKNGSNSISITSGFTLKIIPNWRTL